jgi:hypothetical protein
MIICAVIGSPKELDNGRSYLLSNLLVEFLITKPPTRPYEPIVQPHKAGQTQVVVLLEAKTAYVDS